MASLTIASHCMIFAIDQTSFDLQNYIFTYISIDLRNIFLTVLVIVCACSRSEAPDDLIGQEKMASLMIEIHLLEAKVNNTTIEPADSTQAVYEHLERKIFDKLEISQEQYERSFNYYVDRPNEFEKIYAVVVDSLMEKEKRFK